MDEKYFKYMKPDVAKIVLNNKTIRFTSPLSFNDPYDAHPPYNLKNNHIEDRIIRKTFTMLADDLLILSLSNTNDNLMMWGHYTDCHKGIVIEFNSNAENLKYATKVNYTNSTLTFENINKEYFKSNKLINDIKIIFTTKYKCWEYENEKRVLIDKPTKINFLKDKITNKEIEDLKKQEYIDMPFTTNDIKTIYLGYKIDPNDEQELINIIKTQYPHIHTIYKCRLSKTEYKIIFDSIKI